MSTISTIVSWFSGAHWEAILGVFAAFVLFFDRVAKVIPTSTNSNILAFLQKVATILGAKVPDAK